MLRRIQFKNLYISTAIQGRDYFSYDQNKTFIDHTIQLQKKRE